MYQASDLRKGLKIELDGEPYIVTEFDFCKPGKGQALYRCRIKHLLNGSTMERTFRVVDKIGTPDIYQREVVYSYREGDTYVFSDAKTFEEVRVSAQVLNRSTYFLDDGMACTITLYREKPVEVTLPIFIEKKIGFTEPGARGDTATNVTKPATLENGYEFRVPLFLNQGDTVRIDTRTGEYCERVSKA